MAHYDDGELRAFLERVDLRQVVEAFTGAAMRAEGRNWRCRCPFHEDRTPSFVVFGESRRWQCMAGCDGAGRGGDAIEFVRRAERLGFRDAVMRVAEIAGVAAPRGGRDVRPDGPEAQARAALDAAARRWAERLAGAEGADARAYLSGRGLTVDTLVRYRVGLVADSYQDLRPALGRLGHGIEELEAAGLVARSRDGRGYYDRFRGRLVFPVTGPTGGVIGFGARVLPRHDTGEAPKYVNSPDGPLYRKSAALFGLAQAREAIRREGRAVVVEGYVDVLALAQAGVTATVATCGVALTEAHLATLRSMGAGRVTLAFDGDEPGQRAMASLAPVVLRSGLVAEVAALPAGVDPDELAQSGGAAGLGALLEQAVPLTQFVIDRTVARVCGAGGAGGAASLEARLRVVAELQPLLGAVEGGARGALQVQIEAAAGLAPSLRPGSGEADRFVRRVAALTVPTAATVEVLREALEAVVADARRLAPAAVVVVAADAAEGEAVMRREGLAGARVVSTVGEAEEAMAAGAGRVVVAGGRSVEAARLGRAVEEAALASGVVVERVAGVPLSAETRVRSGAMGLS